jgi:putative endonuclease
LVQVQEGERKACDERAFLFFMLYMFYLYILYSKKLDKYYVGQTENPKGRLEFHNSIEYNSIWTRNGMPWELKITVPFNSRSEAVKAERFVKNQKSKVFIEKAYQGWLAKHLIPISREGSLVQVQEGERKACDERAFLFLAWSISVPDLLILAPDFSVLLPALAVLAPYF